MNKVNGAWDEELLWRHLLQDIAALGQLQYSELTGFEPPEMEALFNKVGDNNGHQDDFDTEVELQKPCFSKNRRYLAPGKAHAHLWRQYGSSLPTRSCSAIPR
jgi:hypothetical protein